MTPQTLKNRLAKITFYLFFFLLLAQSLYASEGTETPSVHEILVIGSARIINDDLANARKAATSEALAKGVEAYIARRLGSRGMANNFPRLINELLPTAREEIENFHILAEERADQVYKILVRVKINEKMMDEKLRKIGLVSTEVTPLKVLFMVSQVESQEGKVSFWWGDPESDSPLTPTELVLHRIFEVHGFRPINRMSNMPEEDFGPDMKTLDLSFEVLFKWGRGFSADVVIHGKCEIIEGEQLSINVTALNVEKGNIISSDAQSEGLDDGIGDVEHITRVVEKAINKIALRLGPAIIEDIEIPEAKTNDFEIVLQGLGSFKQFREFKTFLEREVQGVKSVKQTKVGGSAIHIMVTYQGDEDAFLERVRNHENMPFSADLTRLEEGGGITLKLK